MGKSKQTTGPSKFAKPYIQQAQQGLSSAVNANQGNVNNIMGQINSGLPSLAAKAFGPNATLDAAKGYASDVIGGKYLTGNPHLEGMIGLAREGVTNDVNSVFSRAGRVGGGAHSGALGKSLSEAELGLRYGDYASERDRMAQAAGMVPGLTQAEYAGVMPYLAAAGTAAELPLMGAKTLAAGTQGLMGNYTTTTQKQGAGSMLGGILGAGLAGWASGGFRGV